MIPQHGAGFTKAAKHAGPKVGAKQTAFFVNGEDYRGAGAETRPKLACAEINMCAVQAVCEGKGRYGAVIFLAQSSILKAAKAIGIS
jgi:hypothetical protein